jgi:hypothetical protein
MNILFYIKVKSLEKVKWLSSALSPQKMMLTFESRKVNKF